MSERRFTDHPDVASLGRFVRGDLPREEAREVVRHLLAGCGDCRRQAGAWWPRELTGRDPGEPEPANVVEMESWAPAAAYRPMFARVAESLAQRERAFAAERRAATELRASLAELSPEQRRERLLGDPAYHLWTLVEALLDDSRGQGFSRPEEAVELADLGRELADRLDESRYSSAAVHDLRARARAYHGNALRIRAEFGAAQKAFDEAAEELELGSGDQAEKCRLLSLQAALYGDQQRFDEAHLLLDRMSREARRIGDGHMEGSALLRKARLAQLQSEPERAADLLRRSLDLIDPGEDPRQVLVASHNLLSLLADLGRLDEALERLESVRTLHLQLGSRIDRLRLRWLEAQLFERAGRLEQAMQALTEVRTRFLEEGLAYDVALASLDLAAIHGRRGEGREVRRLAEEMLPIFRSRQIHREAMAALLVFREAAREDAAGLALIREVADYLRRARTQPDLPFRAAAATA